MLVRHGDPAVADAFCNVPSAGDWGEGLGTLPPEPISRDDHPGSAPPV